MSQENVEIVKRAIDAVNRRDADGLAEFLTPDCEWFPAMLREVEGMAFQGREGLDAYLAAIADTWEEFRIVVDEFRPFGDDRVLGLGRLEGRGRGSGVQVETPWAVVYDFDGDKLSRIRAFLAHDDAVKAVGLAE
jgi:ketosteroid isomerase-like protein